MQATFKFSQRIVNGILVSCLLCLVLPLLSGCGGGGSLTPAEQAEVDKLIAGHGRNALWVYLANVYQDDGDPDEKRILKYCKYLVSQGADVNATHKGYSVNYTPLDMAKSHHRTEVVEYLSGITKKE